MVHVIGYNDRHRIIARIIVVETIINQHNSAENRILKFCLYVS